MRGTPAEQMRLPRQRLVETLRARGITDLAVLRAFDLTPRHIFVPSGTAHRAYEDSALPIGNGQTISQPSVHATYLQALALTGQERVLEIGTGSGYQTVLLSHLARQVFSVERIGALLETARAAMQACGSSNITLLQGDGTLGWKAFAPYDAILVSAAAPDLPPPLVEQLAEGGRLLAPVGSREVQDLLLMTRRGARLERRSLGAMRFVPLIGAHGWPEQA